MKNLGLQIYTVIDLLDNDGRIDEVIKKIKDIGYGCVQLCGSLELVKKVSKACQKYSLPIVGYLSDIDTLENNADEIFAVAKEYGMKDLGVSSSVSGCKETLAYIDRVNSFAKKVREAGFSFSYHNHSAEFIKTESGETVMELMMKNFSRDVDFMPDTYWIAHGGYDVRRFIEQTKGRAKIIHLKDMIKTKEGHMYAEIGEGNLWFEGILKTAVECGAEYYIVEQDICQRSELESIEISYNNLKKVMEA